MVVDLLINIFVIMAWLLCMILLLPLYLIYRLMLLCQIIFNFIFNRRNSHEDFVAFETCSEHDNQVIDVKYTVKEVEIIDDSKCDNQQ